MLPPVFFDKGLHSSSLFLDINCALCAICEALPFSTSGWLRCCKTPSTSSHDGATGPSPPGISCKYVSQNTKFAPGCEVGHTMQMLLPFNRILDSLVELPS